MNKGKSNLQERILVHCSCVVTDIYSDCNDKEDPNLQLFVQATVCRTPESTPWTLKSPSHPLSF